jgi:hypothetical protein
LLTSQASVISFINLVWIAAAGDAMGGDQKANVLQSHSIDYIIGGGGILVMGQTRVFNGIGFFLHELSW